jgi:hypothetical protein
MKQMFFCFYFFELEKMEEIQGGETHFPILYVDRLCFFMYLYPASPWLFMEDADMYIRMIPPTPPLPEFQLNEPPKLNDLYLKVAVYVVQMMIPQER